MKVTAGWYRLPDMLPADFNLPGAYTFTNISERYQVIELRMSPREEPYYRGGMRAGGGTVVVFLEEECYISIDAEVEVSPYQLPESFGKFND